MKRNGFFWKYCFPPIYGLVVYFTIRLLLDTVTGMKFWKRSWQLNLTEFSACIVFSFIFLWVMDWLFRRFDRAAKRSVANELLQLLLLNVVFQNVFLTPIAAFTDDGLQWYDVADINFIPVFYSFIYYGIYRSVQLEKMRNDHLQTELKFLKAQYHPHFLFNALNTIYFQMDENVAEAKKSVEKFSDLLRYQLYDQQQTVSLSQEVRYLESFIQLQEVRSSEKLRLSVHFDPRLNGQQVYPLLLLPFVENAFKYVGGEYWIRIDAKIENRDLHFRVDNAIPVDVVNTKTGGIGLENLRRRLALLYPGQHHMSTELKDAVYEAELIIKNIDVYG